MSLCATGLLTRGFIQTCQEVIYANKLNSCKTPEYKAVVEVRPKIRQASRPVLQEVASTAVSVTEVTASPNVSVPPIAPAGDVPKPISATDLVPKVVKAEEE